MNSLDFIKKTRSGEIDIVENTKRTLDKIKEINSEYHYFLHISANAVDDAKLLKSKKEKGRLYGLPISIKDCICVKDMESRAGSRILEGYKPLFDATVIEKIRKEGGIIIGKTSQDIFGFGSFNVNVGLNDEIPINPFDKTRTTGGSSGGASGITQKLDMPHIAISESTGGSIASPASYCGVLGLCPTYGRVSRYGLIDFSNSMDKIGVTAKNIEEIALMLEIIAGHDEKDSTSMVMPVPHYTKNEIGTFKLAIIKESIGEGVEPGVKNNLLKKIGKQKYSFINMPDNFKYSILIYYLLNMAEVSTNLSKLCGMRYGVHEQLSGNFNEYFTKVRSLNFEKEAKRRIILGTFARMSGFRDAYYTKALKIRTKIIQQYKNIFEKYDLIITPSMPGIAPRLSEINKMTPLQNYLTDIMTAGPNLAGFPHISIPSGLSENMPTGLLAIADHFQEKKLIDFCRRLA